MSLAAILEEAACALPQDADAIRPANGDADQLLRGLGEAGGSRLLSWLLCNAPEAGAEVAETWCEEAEGAALVQSLDSQDLPKAGRKILRRTLHRLRSRGVEIDTPKKAPAQYVSRLPSLDDVLEVAHVSGLDPRGARKVYLMEGKPGGGARLFEAVLDEERGVVDFQAYAAGRARVRALLKTLTSGSSLPIVEAQPGAVRALIRRALAAHPVDRPVPKAMKDWRTHFSRADDATQTPGEEVAHALAGGGAPEEGCADVVEGVRQGALGPWPPALTRLQDLGKQLEEQCEGQIIVSGAREHERLEEALMAAGLDLFDEEFTELTVRRLEETAYVSWKRGDEVNARGCLATARVLREGGDGAHPIARGFAEVLLRPVLDRLRTKSPEDESTDPSSLVVTP